MSRWIAPFAGVGLPGLGRCERGEAGQDAATEAGGVAEGRQKAVRASKMVAMRESWG